MSAQGKKQTWKSVDAISALPPIADNRATYPLTPIHPFRS